MDNTQRGTQLEYCGCSLQVQVNNRYTHPYGAVCKQLEPLECLNLSEGGTPMNIWYGHQACDNKFDPTGACDDKFDKTGACNNKFNPTASDDVKKGSQRGLTSNRKK